MSSANDELEDITSDPSQENPEEKKTLGPIIARIISIAQTIAVICTAAFLIYTRLIFKRPAITEQSERTRLAAIKKVPQVELIPDSIKFNETTINLAPSNDLPQGGLHYLVTAFTLEISDAKRKGEVEALRPILTDRFLSIIGRKKMEEITHPQGRYLLRNQMIDSANEIIGKTPDVQPLISNLHFTQFMVQ